MKISGQLLKKIILEEIAKVVENQKSSKDVEKVAQSVEKSSGFEAKIAAINTEEELAQLLQFVISKLDSKKFSANNERLKWCLMSQKY